MTHQPNTADGWPSDPREFGRSLRNLREVAGLSRQALADKAQISRFTLRNYEKGLHGPSQDKLDRLITALRQAWQDKVDRVQPKTADGWPSDPPEFGRWLRNFREVAGLSRQALADKAQISWFTLRNYEKGLHGPSQDKRHRLITALRQAWQDKVDRVHKSNADKNKYLGSTLDQLLAEQGILAEVERVAAERIQVMQRADSTAAQSQTDCLNTADHVGESSHVPVNQHKK